MGEHNRPINCIWCRSTHGRRFLCDPAAELLAASAARGAALTLPAIELDAAPEMTPDPRADLLVGQLVVKAGLFPLPGGVVHPALVFTGMDVHMRTLPQWIYVAGDDGLLRQAAPLVRDMTELAIRRADKQNQGGRRG
jgi:hypothetical protein